MFSKKNLLGLLLLFALLLSGCGQNTNNPQAQTNNSNSPNTENANQEQSSGQKTVAEQKQEIQPAKYLSFSSSRLGVSIIYPDNWKPDPTDAKTILSMSSPTGKATLSLFCNDLKPLADYEEYANEINKIETIAGIVNDVVKRKNYTLISNSTFNLNGLKAYKVYIRGVVKNIKIRSVQLATIKNGVNCTFTFGGDEESYNLYINIAEKMISSLTLK